MDIISFAKLFNFDDNTKLTEAIELLDKFSAAYSNLVKIADKNAASLTASLKEVSDAAHTLEKATTDVNVSEKELQELMLKSAPAADKLIKSYDNINKAITDNTKAEKDLLAQQKQLEKSKKDLEDQNKAEAGSLAALRAEMKAAEKEYMNMGDASDELAKQEVLDRISELSKGITLQESALKSAKKSVDVAVGSYDALVLEVSEAKKQLKAMEGGIGSNSEEFKALQKTVADGTEKLKHFDEEIGDNKRSVGDYGVAIDKLDDATGGAVSGVKNLVSAFRAIIVSPVGLVIAAIAAAIGALTAYFKSSVEGQDRFNTVIQVGKAILETLLDVLEAVGKAIFEALSEPGKIVDYLVGKFKEVKESIIAAFRDPIGTIDKFLDYLKTQVVKRFQAVAIVAGGFQKVMAGEFKQGFKDIGDGYIQMFTGIEKGLTKLIDVAAAAAEAAKIELERRIALGLKIADLENKIRKEKIADIVDDAKTELSVYELLLKAKNKQRFSDEERFDFLRQANKQLEDQLQGDLDLIREEIELQKLVIQQSGDTYEAREKLAQLQVEEITLQSSFLKARKKRQAEEIALIREIEKDTQDRIQREKDAQRALNEFIINGRIAANKQLIADERTTFEERMRLIEEVAQDQEDLATSSRDKQLDAAKEGALARIELEGDTLDKIYDNETISINERIAQERAAKEQLLGTDQAYVEQVDLINKQYVSDFKRANDEAIKAGSDNVYKHIEDSYKDLVNLVGSRSDLDLIATEEDFKKGLINLNEYNEAVANLERQAQQNSLQEQLKYLQAKAKQLEKDGFNTLEVQKAIYDVQLQLERDQNSEQLQLETDKQNALQELKQVASDTALSLVDSYFTAEQEKTQARLDQLAQNFQTEQLLAGDNDAKKLELANAYNLERSKLEKEQRASQRKQAIFEKALAIAEIAINTAKGIGAALGYGPPGIVLGAIIGVIGALQIAAVLARPVPAFAEGGVMKESGLALVNDGDGKEIVQGRDGKMRIYDTEGAALVHLNKGDRVFNAGDTAEMFRTYKDGDRLISGFDDDSQKLQHIKVQVDNDKMINVLTGSLSAINNSINNNKTRPFDYDKLGKAVGKSVSTMMFEAKQYA